MIEHSQHEDREPGLDDACAATQRALLESGYAALRHVRCHRRGDIVRLEGNVSSFYLKQMAQKAAQGVEGVRKIENRVSVRRGPSAGPRNEQEPPDTRAAAQM
jgi:osmotically-inducible protein OsmY